MENYFTYFSEIEEHYLRRRRGGLLLSTLDWALIETWKDAGIPLEAVLRGIDNAFDKYDLKPSKSQKINSLAYCAQGVLTAAEEMKEAAVGVAEGAPAKPLSAGGLEPGAVATFLRRAAETLAAVRLPEGGGVSGQMAAQEAARTLRTLAEESESKKPPRLEDLERHLTVLEEKMFAALLAATPDADLVAVRAEADRDLIPYRRKMPSSQIEQLHKQYVNKRLLEKYGLPRLSLFYM